MVSEGVGKQAVLASGYLPASAGIHCTLLHVTLFIPPRARNMYPSTHTGKKRGSSSAQPVSPAFKLIQFACVFFHAASYTEKVAASSAW